ncbi:MAG TPA: butyrate kinase [archaeon]|nr:butyrate kinase [archaeon]
MQRPPLILVLNPGSTTTKLAVYRGPRRVTEWTKSHLHEVDDSTETMIQLAEERVPDILDDLSRRGYDPEEIQMIVARGGLLKPLQGGVYEVNEKMVEDLAKCAYGRHQSNLGGLMAWRIATSKGKKSYVVNPVVVDELSPVARISGHPGIPRKSIFHALNQKAVAAKVCAKISKPYKSARLIVVHAGGGVTVGAHFRGRVVDVNNGLEGEGPFSPERTGSLPLLDFLRFVSEKGLSLSQVQQIVTRNSGMSAYLGTKDCREIEKRIKEGDPRARLIYKAFVYQVAKEIGALAAAVFKGRLDAIILTGGIAGGAYFRRWIRDHVGFLAPVFSYPRTSEMESLAMGGWEIWRKKIKPAAYC